MNNSHLIRNKRAIMAIYHSPENKVLILVSTLTLY